MGQKTHPYGFRLGYNKPWKSRWYADRDYAELLHEDVKLRRELKEKLKSAGISSIDIERAANKLVVRIYTAEAHQARSAHRHSGSASAGTRRHAGGGVDRVAARKARGISPRDAQSR
jgi:hypothetical protein